jgi:hypothetical protein
MSCPVCLDKGWLWKGRPHEGGDTRCPRCNREPKLLARRAV